MGALRKLQNSIQTLVIFWPVYPIHTNPLFWVTFEELSFCHFLPPNTSIRGKDSQNLVDLSFEHLSFSSKRKTTILFPSPLTFLQWPIGVPKQIKRRVNTFFCFSKFACVPATSVKTLYFFYHLAPPRQVKTSHDMARKQAFIFNR